MSGNLKLEMERIKQDIVYFSSTLGPRPHGSKEARLASLYIKDELTKAGWEPQFIHLQENIVSCKGSGKMLFLAHSDSVSTSPGVIDNAVGVSILLELARTLPNPDICLGFPAAEENGLIGSQHLSGLIQKWHPNPDNLSLVVALDLTGYGSLSVTGLGPSWGTDNLNWLYDTAHPISPYAYQAVSRAFPHMERSDHAPFANNGYLSLHLLGRGPSGVFPAYHQPEDEYYSLEAIQETANTLFQFTESKSIIPPPSYALDSALVFGNFVLPSWGTWLCIFLGLAAGASQYKSYKKLPLLLSWGLGAALVASLPITLLIQSGFFETTPAEQTAQAVMGISATGWWLGATWFSMTSALLWIGIRQKIQLNAPSSLLCAIFICFTLALDPILAFPFAVAAFLSRLWPPAALIPAAYWLQPAILRELSFHGILPPMMWGIFWVLAIPAFAIKNTEVNHA